jgi:hypothetical protein
MNKEETQKEIEKLKTKFKDFEEIEKNGFKYTRFVLQKVDIPEGIGKKFLQIVYDDNDVPYVVITVNNGLTEKEKERRKKAAEKRRAERKVVIDKRNAEIQAAIKEIKAKYK